MAIQFYYAAKGLEFTPTYKGRYLQRKFKLHPEYAKRVPKRWVTEGWVEERKGKE